MKKSNIFILIGIGIIACSSSYFYGHYTDTCDIEYKTPVERVVYDTIKIADCQEPCDMSECPELDYEVYERLALSEEKGNVIQQICDIEKQLIIQSYENNNN